MKASIKWLKNAIFLGESGSGHCVLMDGPEDHGGSNMGIRPMEMLLLGVGGCASFDLVRILKKSRQQVIDCRVELTAERAQSVPSPFISMHLQFIISGNNLKDKQVERAVELSATKYCSAAMLMTAAGVEVTHSHKIVNLPP